MIGGSKKYEINFDGHQYIIKVKRPLTKKLFGKERHEYLFSFSFLEKIDLNMEESVKELLLFLNPVINRKRYAITDKNPEFEQNFELFTHQLDAIIASHTKPNEEEYITGLIGLLTRLRIEKAGIDAQVAAHEAKAVAIAHAKKMEKLFANVGPKTKKKKSRNQKSGPKMVSLPTIWEGIEGGRQIWRSFRRRK
jgi:hypothetical protein